MKITELTRYLRRNQTPAEKKFWEALRNRQLTGKKFLRQHPVKIEIDSSIRYFIADFYCAECRVIVELDGPVHERQKDYDELRSWILGKMDYQVVSFTNDEVFGDIDTVLYDLRKLVD